MRNAKVKKSNKILAAITAAMLATITVIPMSVFHSQGKILHVLILEERTIPVQAGATAMIQVTVKRDFIFRCMERQNIIIPPAVTADAGHIIFQKTRHGICGI